MSSLWQAGTFGRAFAARFAPLTAAPRVGWLLVLPVLAVMVISPRALGAHAARRDPPRWSPPSPRTTGSSLAAPRDGAVDMSHDEFLARAYYDNDNILAGATVRLTGFVVGDATRPGVYQLTRLQLACCAADAFRIQVAVHGADQVPPDDTWVEVTAIWRQPLDGAEGVDREAEVDLVTQVVIPAPASPDL